MLFNAFILASLAMLECSSGYVDVLSKDRSLCGFIAYELN